MSKEQRGKLCQCFLFTYLGHPRCDHNTCELERVEVALLYYFVAEKQAKFTPTKLYKFAYTWKYNVRKYLNL